MKKAIKKAIEGGWSYRGINSSNFADVTEGSLEDDVIIYSNMNKYIVMCSVIREDRTFWQALGKAEGWKKECPCKIIAGSCSSYCQIEYNIEGWQLNWHRFIDHLAEGKDAESFFNSLIK